MYLLFGKDSIGWWDADKTQQHSKQPTINQTPTTPTTIRQKSSYSTSDSGIIDGIDDFDALSIKSGAPILSSQQNIGSKSTSSKSKWLKKLMSPVKKSSSKKDKAQAEQLLF